MINNTSTSANLVSANAISKSELIDRLSDIYKESDTNDISKMVYDLIIDIAKRGIKSDKVDTLTVPSYPTYPIVTYRDGGLSTDPDYNRYGPSDVPNGMEITNDNIPTSKDIAWPKWSESNSSDYTSGDQTSTSTKKITP